MGRIVVCENPLNPEIVRRYEHDGPYIDWLDEHYPNGFVGQHVTALNGERLPVVDYDVTLGDKDTLVLVTAPGAPGVSLAIASFFTWGNLARILVSTAISIGLSYLANSLLGPKGSKPTAPRGVSSVSGGSSPEAASVYSLTTPTNTARVGQVIPVPYGRNIIVPDQAMAPYAFYQNNDNYVDQIMVIGQGEYEIEDIRIGNNPVDQLADGTAQYWIYPRSAHQETFGIINAATGIRENVYTSPEVNGIELSGAKEQGCGGAFSSAVDIWYGEWPGEGGPWNLFHLSDAALEYAEAFRAGQTVYIYLRGMGKPANENRYYINYLYNNSCYDDGNCAHPEWLGKHGYIGGPLSPSSWPSPPDSGTAYLSFDYNFDPDAEGTVDGTGATIGPFAASPPCWPTSTLEYDLVWPNGCYDIAESGGVQSRTVSVQFYAEQIDNNGDTTGFNLTKTVTETFATATPQRKTYQHSVPYGRYRVSVKRTTPEGCLGRSESRVYWAGLKSVLGTYCDRGTSVYGDVTLLALRLRAGEKLSSDAAQLVRVVATRKLNGTATRSPIEAFKDIYTNSRYSIGRPSSDMDLTALAAVAAEVPTCTFDAIFDVPSTVYEALKMSVQLIRGLPITRGGTLSLVRDKPVNTPVYGLNEDRISALSISFLFDEEGQYDGIEGEYIDPVDGTKQYVLYPLNSAMPDQITLWGCQDKTRANCIVQQIWRTRLYRRTLLTMDCELDPHTLYLGAPINVQHNKLGTDAVFCVITKIESVDDLRTRVSAYQYDPEVFET